MSTRQKIRPGARAFALLTAVLLVVGLLTTLGASAAPKPTFKAVGSARQVYVTNVTPKARMSLLDSAGKVVKTQTANAGGAVLFRDVAPASGYRVRRVTTGATSGALTVHTNAA